MRTYYVGLANTTHDPAIAVVDDEGGIRFAEAIERPLQTKRAWGAPPDHVGLVADVIERYCPGEARFVVASPWTGSVQWLMRLYALLGKLRPSSIAHRRNADVGAFLVEDYQLHWMLARQHVALGQVGVDLAFVLRNRFGHGRVEFRRVPHHTAHATYAAWASGLSDAAVLVVDGFGEFGAISGYRLRDGRLSQESRSFGSGSLGYYYARLTEWCGFDPIRGEEWKVMGLAPYGTVDPDLYRALRSLLVVRKGARLAFASPRHLARISAEIEPRRRRRGQPIEAAADLARSGQQVFVDVMAELLAEVAARTGERALVLTGGCALNSAYNGMIARDTPFERVFVPSAPGDDGNAVGAALLAYLAEHPEARPPTTCMSPYLGSSFDPRQVEDFVRFSGLDGIRHLPDTIEDETARLLADGRLVGWVQGRAEFGPRALGNRSILADPRSPEMKDTLNARVKFREAFRPFAPSILHDAGPEWFEDYQFGPYMERTLVWKPSVRDRVPAVVHDDGTGRHQSVTAELNPRYHRLISAFAARTGVPVLLNTSFNVMGRPIVHGVEDAVSVFFTSGLDALVLGDHLITKPGVR